MPSTPELYNSCPCCFASAKAGHPIKHSELCSYNNTRNAVLEFPPEDFILGVQNPEAGKTVRRYKKILGRDRWQPLEKLFPLSGGKFRRSSWWDDHGEMHPFDDEGPDLQVELALDEPVCRLALYMEDHDWKTTAHPRQQSVIIYDQNGDFRNAAWLGKLDDGVYARFLLRDFDKDGLRVCKHRGACVAVSGLFVDYPSNTDAVSGKNARTWLGSERANLFKNYLDYL